MKKTKRIASLILSMAMVLSSVALPAQGYAVPGVHKVDSSKTFKYIVHQDFGSQTFSDRNCPLSVE